MTRSGGTPFCSPTFDSRGTHTADGFGNGEEPGRPSNTGFPPRKTNLSGLVVVPPRRIGVTAFGSAVPDPQRINRGYNMLTDPIYPSYDM